ncbi:transporter [Lampropedia aestuarii]|uniref:Transporter n=1 Tax=Lampropedia aestuarii TaxID=2562762 RepID=A0A4S5BMF8_9BURK|nr:transporter [Lampropedia aestuarii]THJ30888.1 transporter [Lampropedia aestuarii]
MRDNAATASTNATTAAATKAAPGVAAAPTAPAAPAENTGIAWPYVLTSILLGLTQGLGMNLVNSNLPGIQGSLGATSAEASWLVAAYFATNIPATLLLAKIRYQFGLRWFADVTIGMYFILGLTHLLTNHLGSAIAIRAALGLASAPISSLTMLFMLQALPQAKALFAAIVAFGILQMGSPLSRIISEDLLINDQWQGLTYLTIALALLSLAAINIVRLRPMPTMQAFTRGDGMGFGLYAIGMALLIIVLAQASSHWWTATPWIGVCLATAFVCFGLYVYHEWNRPYPLIDLHWLTSPFMLRFIGAMFLFRTLQAQQTVGAVSFMNSLGFYNDQMHGLFMVIGAGTVFGFLLALAAIPSKRYSFFGEIALVVVFIVALMDGHATVLTRPDDLYVSQFLLAMAGSMFMAMALLQGFMHVVAGGMKHLISFIAVLTGGTSLASLFGQSMLSTYVQDRTRVHYAHLADGLSLSDPLVMQRLKQLQATPSMLSPDHATASQQAAASLTQQVTQQSVVMAYNDLSHAMAVLAAIGFFLFLAVKWYGWHRSAVSTSPATSPRAV